LRPQAKSSLCAELDGFSLHANTCVAPRDRERLEALCRYAARPAVSGSRLAELPDGRIGYALKRRFADGTTAVVMTNAVLMERLCALVSPPRKHLVTYHGVLAPASGLRPYVASKQKAAPAPVCGCHTAVAVAAVAGSACRGRTCCGACLASTCWSVRNARARGACWRRSTIRRRSRGCSRRSY